MWKPSAHFLIFNQIEDILKIGLDRHCNLKKTLPSATSEDMRQGREGWFI